VTSYYQSKVMEHEYGWIECKHCKSRIILAENWGAVSGGKFICDKKECLDKEATQCQKS